MQCVHFSQNTEGSPKDHRRTAGEKIENAPSCHHMPPHAGVNSPVNYSRGEIESTARSMHGFFDMSFPRIYPELSSTPYASAQLNGGKSMEPGMDAWFGGDSTRTVPFAKQFHFRTGGPT